MSGKSLPWQGEELDAKLFDYYEGTLAADEVTLIEAHLRAVGEPLRDAANGDIAGVTTGDDASGNDTRGTGGTDGTRDASTAGSQGPPHRRRGVGKTALRAALREAAQPAPDVFAERVAATIHARSGGRFFGKATWADRIPLGLFLALALGIAAAAAWFWRDSQTVIPKASTLPGQPTPIAPSP